MSNEEEKSPEELLEDKMKLVREKGDQIAEYGRKYTKEGQEIIDLSEVSLPTVKYIQPGTNIENTLDEWTKLDERVNLTLQGLNDLENARYVLSTSTSSTAYSTSFILIRKVNITNLPLKEQTGAVEAIERFRSYIGRPALRESVIELFVQFGLDVPRKGKKSPIALLKTAFEAHDLTVTPDDPISTSLIPMRECIQLMIQYLLACRPQEEEAKNDWYKVLSISNQLKREGIDKNDITTWAGQLKSIKDELSEAKEASLSREEWGDRLNRATLFLVSFLKGLDPSKLRKNLRSAN